MITYFDKNTRHLYVAKHTDNTYELRIEYNNTVLSQLHLLQVSLD